MCDLPSVASFLFHSGAWKGLGKEWERSGLDMHTPSYRNTPQWWPSTSGVAVPRAVCDLVVEASDPFHLQAPMACWYIVCN